MTIRTFLIDYKDKTGADMHREHYITGVSEMVEAATDLEIVDQLELIYKRSGYKIMAIMELFDGYHYAELLRMHLEGKSEEASTHVRPFYLTESAIDDVIKEYKSSQGVKNNGCRYGATHKSFS